MFVDDTLYASGAPGDGAAVVTVFTATRSATARTLTVEVPWSFVGFESGSSALVSVATLVIRASAEAVATIVSVAVAAAPDTASDPTDQRPVPLV